MASRINPDTNIDEQPGLANGVNEAVRELLQLAPEVLQLHRSLSTGLAGTQAREHERLAKKYGAEHPRVMAAAERISALKDEGALLEDGLSKVSRFIEPLLAESLFSGFVSDSQGDPAVGYVVHVTARGKQTAARTAKTDEQGYFRIDLDPKSVREVVPRADVAFTTHLARFARGLAAAPAPATGTKADTKASAAADAPAKQEFDVTVTDRAGVLVYRDEIPLVLEPGQSTFRYYALESKAPNDPPKDKEPRKTAKAAAAVKAGKATKDTSSLASAAARKKK